MAIYYVDYTTGDDGDSGLTEALAWKTIAKVNGESFSGDDQILFKRGETWREQLTVPSSGSSGSPITFGAYGTGADPIISGADVITGWTEDSGGVWHKAGITTEPRIVHYNGARLNNNPLLPGAHNHNLFDEHFEANPGYDTTFGEEGTPNEDALSSVVGSPSGWGTQCLEVDAADNSNCRSVKTWGTALTDALYARVEVIFTDLSKFTEVADINYILRARNAAYTIVYSVNIKKGALGTTRFQLTCNHSGSGTTYEGFFSIVPNRRYTIEVKYDMTNNLWAWRINGVNQRNNIDSTFPVTSEGTLTSTHPTDIKYLDIGAVNGGATFKGYHAYFDNFAADSTAWCGSELAALDTNEWHWESDTLYVNVGEDPSTHDLEAGQRAYCTYQDSKSYITFQGLKLAMANHSCMYILKASGIVVDTVELAGGGYKGIWGISGATTNPATFTNVIAHGFGSSGINISSNTGTWGNITITSCIVYDNGWAQNGDAPSLLAGDSSGIKVWGGNASDYVTIQNCEAYNNYDQWGDLSGSGIWLDEWSTSGGHAIVRQNKVYDNDSFGISIEHTDSTSVNYNLCHENLNGLFIFRAATNTTSYNNVVYGNTFWGIAVYGGDSGYGMIGNLIKNNISTGNIRNLFAAHGGENAGGGSGNIYTYNCFGAEANDFIEWGQGVYEDTYDAWETAYGSSTYSVESDPLFVSTATPDFHLQAGSPCINAGVDVGLTTDYEGATVPWGAAPDIGAYEYPEIFTAVTIFFGCDF